MFKIKVATNLASTTRCELLTKGQIGAQVQFMFNDHWTNMKKTAVFKRCGKTIDVVDSEWNGDIVTVPSEMTEEAGLQVYVGVYGVSEDGKRITPTLYAPLGTVALGAEPDGDPSTDPTLPVWAQLQGDIDKIKDELEDVSAKAVQVVPQNFSDDEKLQARENIGADGYPCGYHEIKAWRPSDPSTILYRTWANFDIIEPPADASSDLLKAWLFVVGAGTGVYSTEESEKKLMTNFRKVYDAGLIHDEKPLRGAWLTNKPTPATPTIGLNITYADDTYIEFYNSRLSSSGSTEVHTTWVASSDTTKVIMRSMLSEVNDVVNQFQLDRDPTTDMEVANKKYVDQQECVIQLTGIVSDGPPNLTADDRKKLNQAYDSGSRSIFLEIGTFPGNTIRFRLLSRDMSDDQYEYTFVSDPQTRPGYIWYYVTDDSRTEPSVTFIPLLGQPSGSTERSYSFQWNNDFQLFVCPLANNEFYDAVRNPERTGAYINGKEYRFRFKDFGSTGAINGIIFERWQSRPIDQNEWSDGVVMIRRLDTGITYLGYTYTTITSVSIVGGQPISVRPELLPPCIVAHDPYDFSVDYTPIQHISVLRNSGFYRDMPGGFRVHAVSDNNSLEVGPFSMTEITADKTFIGIGGGNFSLDTIPFDDCDDLLASIQLFGYIKSSETGVDARYSITKIERTASAINFTAFTGESKAITITWPKSRFKQS